MPAESILIKFMEIPGPLLPPTILYFTLQVYVHIPTVMAGSTPEHLQGGSSKEGNSMHKACNMFNYLINYLWKLNGQNANGDVNSTL